MHLVETDKAIKTKFKDKNVETKVSVPQFDSLEEMIQNAGGEDKLLEWANKKVAQSAIAAPRNYGAAAAETATEADIIAKMVELAKNWSFSTVRGGGNSVKAKAEKFDRIKALVSGGNFSQEDLLAALGAIS